MKFRTRSSNPTRSPGSPAVDSDILPLSQWLTLLYTCIPVVVFLFGWITTPIAIPIIASVIWSLAISARGAFRAQSPKDPNQLRNGVLIFLLATGLSFFTGLSDLLPQSNDYLKHNLILADLAEYQWPVRYSDGESPFYLCYGIGYYLVPALIGKVTNITWIPWLSFAWSLLGIILLLLAIGRHFPNRRFVSMILVISASGLGAVWLVLKNGILNNLLFGPEASHDTSSTLMSMGLFTSNLDFFTRLLYQPQHGIIGLLVTLAVFEYTTRLNRPSEAFAILAATLTWSPLSAIPGGMILGLSLIKNGIPRFNHSTVAHCISGTLMTALAIAYYLPHVPITDKNAIWETAIGFSWIPWYLGFVCCFVLIPVSGLFWLEWKKPFLLELKPVLIAMILILLITPLFKYGFYSDFRMQISGPAFILIAIGWTKGLLASLDSRFSAAHVWIWLIYVLGAFFPILRTADHLISEQHGAPSIQTIRNQGIISITEMKMPGFDVASQYLGKANSATARWVLKEQ